MGLLMCIDVRKVFSLRQLCFFSGAVYFLFPYLIGTFLLEISDRSYIIYKIRQFRLRLSEVVAKSCSVKQDLLKNSPNLQDPCVGVSF